MKLHVMLSSCGCTVGTQAVATNAHPCLFLPSFLLVCDSSIRGPVPSPGGIVNLKTGKQRLILEMSVIRHIKS